MPTRANSLSPKATPPGLIAQYVATVILVLWAFLATFPVFPWPLGTGLDPSWEYALNLAHAGHLIFGRDVVFTFGPLAYLASPDPGFASASAALALNFGIYLCFVLAICRIVRGVANLWSRLAITIVATCAMLFTWQPGDTIDRLHVSFSTLLLSLVVECPFLSATAFVLAGTLAGMSLLMKLNDGILAFVLFYAVLALSALERRTKPAYGRLVAFAFVPIAAFLIGYLATKSPLAALPSYFVNSLRMVGGYSEAMSAIGPSWQVLLAILGLVLLVLAIPLYKARSIPYKQAVPALLFAFAAFKHGMVRQDEHAAGFQIQLAFACLFLLVPAEGFTRRWSLIVFTFANLVAGALISQRQTPAFARAAFDNMELRHLSSNLSEYLHFTGSWEHLEANIEASLSPLKASEYMTKTIGTNTVADSTWNVDFIRANNWHWRPELVVQSYADIDPTLDRLNALKLAQSGPTFLTLRLEEIDGRHPFLSEPATWQAIFDKYDVTIADSDLFLLKRRSDSRFMDPTPLGEPLTVTWNNTISIPKVPDDEFVVMRAGINKTIWGWLRGLLFRSDPIYVEAIYQDGSKSRFRVTRANLVNGAIVSTLPPTVVGTLHLFGYRMDTSRVIAIRWIATDETELAKTITISWSSIKLKAFEPGAPPFPPTPDLKWQAIWAPGQPIAGSSGAKTASESKALAVYPTNTDPQVLFTAPADMNGFKTLLIRARFSVSDQINVFFGKQIDGRGYGGYVPLVDEWQDVYVNLPLNPYWVSEAGRNLRFDPSSDKSLGAKIEVAGVWGSDQAISTNGKEMMIVPSRGDPNSSAASH